MSNQPKPYFLVGHAFNSVRTIEPTAAMLNAGPSNRVHLVSDTGGHLGSSNTRKTNKEARSRDAKAACTLSPLTSYSRSQLAARTRNYAAGMKKLEPSGITGISLPVRADVQGAYDVYQSAVPSFIDGDAEFALAMAHEWFATR